jgi:hypothetical protein
MEPLLVPRLPDPIACLDETKAANREFTSFAGILSIRDSPCRSAGHMGMPAGQCGRDPSRPTGEP